MITEKSCDFWVLSEMVGVYLYTCFQSSVKLLLLCLVHVQLLNIREAAKQWKSGGPLVYILLVLCS